jgi:hypothetical protein
VVGTGLQKKEVLSGCGDKSEEFEEERKRCAQREVCRTMIAPSFVRFILDVPQGLGDGHRLGETHGLRQPRRGEQDLELDRHLVLGALATIRRSTLLSCVKRKRTQGSTVYPLGGRCGWLRWCHHAKTARANCGTPIGNKFSSSFLSVQWPTVGCVLVMHGVHRSDGNG